MMKYARAFWRICLVLLPLMWARSAQAQSPSILVTNTNDSGAGSLRAAITAANAQPLSTIVFHIPKTDAGFGSGVFTIKLAASLPAVVQPGVSIDGATQTAFTGDTNPAGPEVVINGGEMNNDSSMLRLSGRGGIVKHLVLNGFENGAAVAVENTTTGGNHIEGNYIGCDATGTVAAPNFFGIVLYNSSNNTVGGAGAGAGNLIAFNLANGVWIESGATGNLISHNTISRNGEGIMVGSGTSSSTTGNTISRNSIYSNSSVGINLIGGSENGQVTANDTLDADTGPNNLQNFPLIESATSSGGNTNISGQLDSLAATRFTVELFRSSVAVGADATGKGEGQIFVASQTVTTNASGTASFNFPLTGTFPGQYFAATATNIATGDTSEFGPAQATPSFPAASISDVTINEGNSGAVNATFTVTLTPVPNSTATVHFATTNGTASAGSDYTATSGTLTFGRGVARQTFTVPVLGDTLFEADETAFVNLTPLDNVVIRVPQARLTIINDDGSIVVTTTTDTVDSHDGVTSLREAIIYANAHPGSTIAFNIPPAQASAGVFILSPGAALPAIIANGTIIDGATQTSFSGNTNANGPEIQLSGHNGGFTGLAINASNCAVRGLIINQFGGTGSPYGIALLGPAKNNQITGNFIGTNSSGSAAAPNGTGIFLTGTSSGNVIGDTIAGAANKIAYNAAAGVLVDAGCSGNSIRGNALFANGSMEIDLAATAARADGPTANDGKDFDSGGNGLQNYALITGGQISGGSVGGLFMLDAKPNTGYQIDFYSSPAGSSSGFGPGKNYIFSAHVTTDFGGFSYGSYGMAASDGDVISVITTGPEGTSEFSPGIVASLHAPQLSFTPAAVNLIEGGTQSVAITRSGPTSSPATVYFSNYNSRLATYYSVTIPAGQASANFVVAAPQNSLADGNTFATIYAAAAGYADASLAATVTDDDAPAFSLNFASFVTEGQPAITGTVTRTGSSNMAPVSVQLAADVADQLLINGAAGPATVTIPAGAASASFSLMAIDDALFDDSPAVTISAKAAGYTPGDRYLVVYNNDVPSVSLSTSSLSVAEGGPTITGTVSRNTIDNSSPVTVFLSANPVSRTFQPSTVVIPAGAASATFTLQAFDNELVDGNVSVAITATPDPSSFLASGTATVTVIDNDFPHLSLTVAPGTITEGAGIVAATATVSRVNAGNGAALKVNLQSSIAGYVQVPATVTIPAGFNSTTFFVTALDNNLFTGPLTVFLTASANGFNDTHTWVVVTDNDTARLALTVAPATFSESAGANAATGTVSRNTVDISAGLVVKLASTNTAAARVPASITIPAGATSVTFPVAAVNDANSSGSRHLDLRATAAGFGGGSTGVTVTNDDARSLKLTLSANAVTEGGAAVMATVTRNTANNTAALTVMLGAAPAGQVAIPASVTILAGAAAVSFPVTAVNDLAADGNVAVLLTAASGGYLSSRAAILAVDNDLASSNLFAWGYDQYGQVGDGGHANRLAPTKVALTGVNGIAAGGSHSLAVMYDGTLRAWGYNGGGQLGDGTTVDKLAPVTVSGLRDVKSAAAGWYHSLAVKTDGTVWAWGYNAVGQLGDGSVTDRIVPVKVNGLTGVTAVAASVYSSYALKSDGTVWAWGSNFCGQLGDGTRTDRALPRQIANLAGISAISANGGHALFLKTDGTVWSAGWNVCGQLGNGTIVDSAMPVKVSGLTGITSIAAGYSHSLAVDGSGRVHSWGYNGSGQLGTGSTSGSSVPLLVPGVNNVAAIEAGYGHSVAELTTGIMYAWGLNSWGELADGSNTDRLSPVAIGSVNKITAIAAGYGHGMALGSPTTSLDTSGPTSAGSTSAPSGDPSPSFKQARLSGAGARFATMEAALGRMPTGRPGPLAAPPAG